MSDTTIGRNILGNFVPTDVGTLALWFDAADASTLTLSGSLVTQWNDKSGNGRNFSNVSGTRQPSYSATGFNSSYPTLTFSGSYLTRSTTGTTSSLYTAFFVVDATSTADQYLFDVEVGRFVIAQKEATGSGTGVYNGTTWYSVAAQTGIQIYSFVCTSGGGLFRNGIRFGTITTFGGLALNGANSIGSRFSVTSSFFDGKMCEYLLYNSALNQTSCQQVEGYLAQKWGIQRILPNGHPYKYLPQMDISLRNGFSPQNVNGCILWLDAADTSVFTGGATWFDKSGTGNNATNGTPGSSFMPTTTTWSNGLRAARFVQASKNSIKTTNTIPNSQVSYFVVFRIQAAVGYGFIMINNIDGQRQLFLPAGTTFPVTPRTFAYNASTLNLDPLNQGQGCFWCGIIANLGTNQYTSYPFGVATGIGDVTASSPSQHYFGSGNGDSGYLSIDIGEIIIYNNVLSTANRQKIEGYLAWKWGLEADLPADNPYANQVIFQPTIVPYTFPLFICQPSSFTPLSISGTAFWLDAQDSSTVTSNANSVVIGVRDKGPNARNLTNAMTTEGFRWNQPGTLFNGSYPSFYYNGGGQTYTLGSNSSFSVTQPATFFTVHHRVGNATVQNVFDSTSATVRMVGYYYLYYQYDGTFIYSIFAGNSSTNFPSTISNPAIYSHIFNGVTSQIYENGVLAAAGTAGTSNGTGITIGSSYTQNQETFQGHICEVLCYQGELTTGQRMTIEGYLAWKWGLVDSLSANHPFKLYPPPP